MAWSPVPIQLGRRKIMRALRNASTAVGAPWTHPAPFALSHAGLGVSEVKEFGSNPGRLGMRVYVPATAPAAGAPLIVVLHGCGQSAVEFARDGGWTEFAERQRVPLVLPEQSGDNNQQRCFNWFRPSDVARGRGEVLSIRQMVTEAVRRFRSDPRQVFVIGLSAGGAMAAALLAAYPDVFAAGAVVAGLPVGCARNPAQAFARMANAGADRTPAEWADLARAVGPSRYRGPWPRISIWHGAQDRAVDPRNADNLVAQWTALHDLDVAAGAVSTAAPGAKRSVWGSPHQAAVESWTVESLEHGFPIERASAQGLVPGMGLDAEGFMAPWAAIGAFSQGFPFAGGQGTRWVYAVGVDAVQAIARFWEIA